MWGWFKQRHEEAVAIAEKKKSCVKEKMEGANRILQRFSVGPHVERRVHATPYFLPDRRRA